MRQIVLDTETTGLEVEKGHRVIELGCVELVNRRRTHRTLHHYLQPDREIDPGAQEVHGITAEMLEPVRKTLGEVHADILGQFVFRDTILCGHSLENDLHCLKLRHDRVIDTAVALPRAPRNT